MKFVGQLIFSAATSTFQMVLDSSVHSTHFHSFLVMSVLQTFYTNGGDTVHVNDMSDITDVGETFDIVDV